MTNPLASRIQDNEFGVYFLPDPEEEDGRMEEDGGWRGLGRKHWRIFREDANGREKMREGKREGRRGMANFAWFSLS